MKHERIFTLFTGTFLGFFMAWGAAGCLVTAFQLPLLHPLRLLQLWGLGAVLSASLLLLRRGGTMLLCLLALSLGYVYHDGTAVKQLWQLLYHLSTVYNRAYGLGVLVLPEELAAISGFDWPIGILGMANVLAVCRCICRQKSIWLPLAAALIPFCACVVVTDTVPGEIPLLMVMACLILLLLTSYVRQENSTQGLRLTAAAALPVILTLLAVFLALPQEDYVNHSASLRESIFATLERIPQQLEQKANQLAAAFPMPTQKRIDLAHLGPRIPSGAPVMDVTAQTTGQLYLRQQDFDRYTGLGWASTPNRQEEFSRPEGQEEIILLATRAKEKYRFLPYYPATQTLLLEGSLHNGEGETVYPVLRRPLPENWRQTAYLSGGGTGLWPECTELPEQTRQQAAALLSGLYPPDAPVAQKADLIAALVMESAQYDLDPAMMPPEAGDFALWFLREGERGYCVHFATAAAVLLRAAGIPARYVTGYLVETQADVPVTVTDEQAHAWAEYYEPNLGLWLPLEATPAEDAPVIPFATLTQETLPTQTAAPSEVTGPPPTEAPVAAIPPQRVTQPTEPTAVPPAPVPPAEPPQIPVLPLALPAALMLLTQLQRCLRLELGRRRKRQPNPNRQALARWQETEQLCRLLKQPPPEELLTLAQKAKFSQHALHPEEVLAFDRFNRACLEQLRKKPWYRQLMYRYLYVIY